MYYIFAQVHVRGRASVIHNRYVNVMCRGMGRRGAEKLPARSLETPLAKHPYYHTGYTSISYHIHIGSIVYNRVGSIVYNRAIVYKRQNVLKVIVNVIIIDQ